jgi:hypothetical protein
MLRYVDLKWTSLALLGFIACGDSDSNDHGAAPEPSTTETDGGGSEGETDAQAASSVPAADLQELLDLGIARFLGAAKPTKMETVQGVDGVADGSLVYDFDPADGPKCLRGASYQVSVLDQKSDNLMIYLQGGGACVSAICQATTEAAPRGVPTRGVLDTKDSENPVADWNIVYVPYCDGSVFGGDKDFTNPSDTMGTRYHHGQRNFSAALDLALKHFPMPNKVLLAGSSAGGWGTVYHRGLVRSQYPNAELSVFDDAGIGFAVNNPAVADEWGATTHRPPSCMECQTHPHMSYFVRYMLAHDPGTWVGDFSSYGDSVIRLFTFSPDADSFKQQLLTETAISAQAYPDRYKRFFIQGESHTALQSQFHTAQINGVTVAQWLGKMVNRDPSWSDLLAQ